MHFFSGALVNGTYPSRKEKCFEIEDRYEAPKFAASPENKKLNKKKNKKKPSTILEEGEDEGSLTIRSGSSRHSPSAPPPTPGPSQNEEDLDEGEDEPKYIDADEEDVSGNENVYVAGPDKKSLRV